MKNIMLAIVAAIAASLNSFGATFVPASGNPAMAPLPYNPVKGSLTSVVEGQTNWFYYDDTGILGYFDKKTLNAMGFNTETEEELESPPLTNHPYSPGLCVTGHQYPSYRHGQDGIQFYPTNYGIFNCVSNTSHAWTNWQQQCVVHPGDTVFAAWNSTIGVFHTNDWMMFTLTLVDTNENVLTSSNAWVHGAQNVTNTFYFTVGTNANDTLYITDLNPAAGTYSPTNYPRLIVCRDFAASIGFSNWGWLMPKFSNSVPDYTNYFTAEELAVTNTPWEPSYTGSPPKYSISPPLSALQNNTNLCNWLLNNLYTNAADYWRAYSWTNSDYQTNCGASLWNDPKSYYASYVHSPSGGGDVVECPDQYPPLAWTNWLGADGLAWYVCMIQIFGAPLKDAWYVKFGDWECNARAEITQIEYLTNNTPEGFFGVWFREDNATHLTGKFYNFWWSMCHNDLVGMDGFLTNLVYNPPDLRGYWPGSAIYFLGQTLHGYTFRGAFTNWLGVLNGGEIGQAQHVWYEIGWVGDRYTVDQRGGTLYYYHPNQPTVPAPYRAPIVIPPPRIPFEPPDPRKQVQVKLWGGPWNGVMQMRAVSELTTNYSTSPHWWTNWPVVQTNIVLDGMGQCDAFGVYDTNLASRWFIFEWYTNNVP